MNATIPPELQSTWAMIRGAFPTAIDEWAYFPLLAALYEHMSDRNLALVVASVTSKPYAVVLNDVYHVGGNLEGYDGPEKLNVMARLRANGFGAWVAE